MDIGFTKNLLVPFLDDKIGLCRDFFRKCRFDPIKDYSNLWGFRCLHFKRKKQNQRIQDIVNPFGKWNGVHLLKILIYNL